METVKQELKKDSPLFEKIRLRLATIEDTQRNLISRAEDSTVRINGACHKTNEELAIQDPIKEQNYSIVRLLNEIMDRMDQNTEVLYQIVEDLEVSIP